MCPFFNQMVPTVKYKVDVQRQLADKGDGQSQLSDWLLFCTGLGLPTMLEKKSGNFHFEQRKTGKLKHALVHDRVNNKT